MNRRKLCFTVMAVIWMAVIFAFSSRNADESTDDSYRVGLMVGNVIVPDFGEKTEEQQLEFAQSIDHPVRKLAHATEYAVLGMLLCGAILDRSTRRSWYIPWMVATVYAATDEIHQIFVPGRDGNIKDVCIDSAGALTGCLLSLLFACCIASLQKASDIR